MNDIAAPVIKIILSERATAALLAASECFAIVGKGSYPEAPGRMVIYCQAVPMATATAACQILAGSHRAQRVKVPAAGTATAPQASDRSDTPDRRPDATPANLDASPTIAGNRPAQPILAFP